MIPSINHELGYCSCKEPWSHPINALEELGIEHAEMRWLAACDVLVEWRKERRRLAFQIVVGGWFWEYAEEAAIMRGLPERKRNQLAAEAEKIREANQQRKEIQLPIIEDDLKAARAAVAERASEFPPAWQKYALAVADWYRPDHPAGCPEPHLGPCKPETFIHEKHDSERQWPMYARA